MANEFGKTTFSRLSVSTFLAAVVLFLAVQEAHGALSCSSLFSNKANNLTQVLVSNRSDVKNQCSLGTCHLYAWAAKLEQDYNKKNARPIEISASYWSAQHWQQDALKFIWLLQPESDLNLVDFKSLGLPVYESRDLIQQFGIVPQEVWTPKTAFESAEVSKKIELKLHSIFEKFIDKWKQSRDTNLDEKLIEKTKQEVLQLFRKYVGVPPEKFIYRGQEYTPQEFQQKFFPEITDSVVVIDKTSGPPLEESMTRVTVTNNGFEKIALKQINNGQAVIISYDTSLIPDNESVVIALSKKKVDLEQSEGSHEGPSYHAALLVGYEMNDSKKVTNWIIQNSWGKDSGKGGYYKMSNEYFKRFSNYLIFFEHQQDAK